MHVCRQQCMRFILRSRQFKDFLKPPLKLNYYEYDMFDKPNVSVYFVLKVLRWWIYWHRLHQFANCADDKFLRMRRKFWEGDREMDPLKDWANHPQTNKLGMMFFYVVQLWLTICTAGQKHVWSWLGKLPLNDFGITDYRNISRLYK